MANATVKDTLPERRIRQDLDHNRITPRRRCQIEVQFESGETSFFKYQKKAILMNQISPKWYYWVYGTRILQKKSPPCVRALKHPLRALAHSCAIFLFYVGGEI